MDGSLILIVGDAPCREDDLAAFYDFEVDHETCCINRAGLKHPFNFEHWFSWHADILGNDWAVERPGAELHSTYQGHNAVRLWDIPYNKGGSLFGALWVCLEKLGYDKAVLCGCPMTGSYERFLDDFYQLDDFGPRIRSMSGNTRNIFGYPDAAWLEG